MTQQAVRDLQAETAGHQVRGVGMAIVVQAIALEAGFSGRRAPELLDPLKRFSRRVSGKQVGAVV